MNKKNPKSSLLFVVCLVGMQHGVYAEQPQRAFALENLSIELWNGPYLGLHFAAGSGKMKENSSVSARAINSISGGFGRNVTTTSTIIRGFSSGTLTGSEADVFIGYNVHQPYSRLVWGGQLEGTIFDDISIKTIGTNNQSSRAITQNFNGSGVITSTSTVDMPQSSVSQRNINIESMFSFLGRGGFLLEPHTYFFGLVGGTEANMTIPNGTDPIGSRRSWWVLGWTAGTGVEYRITEHWSFLGEYRYTALNYTLHWENPNSNTRVDSVQTNVNTNNNYADSQASLNLNLGKIGVVYRI
ncbi:MAG: hypothetical protein CK424_06725 [Legionella sp.]|nr:MAG: hypothetical protein CK424_06725 [Legionella sp.]